MQEKAVADVAMADKLLPAVADTATVEVCMIAPSADIAMVPCGHARLCENHAN